MTTDEILDRINKVMSAPPVVTISIGTYALEYEEWHKIEEVVKQLKNDGCTVIVSGKFFSFCWQGTLIITP